jgi:hypothetical protein
LFRGDIHHRAAGDNTSRVPFTVLKAFGSADATFGAAEGMTGDGIPEILA